MRFDYYSATIEDDPITVMKTLSKLGDQTLTRRCDRLAKAYRYETGWEVIHPETGTACKIFAAQGQRPFAFASSDATDSFADAIREEWPSRHLVTRMDPCQDFYDEKARAKIRRLMWSVARERNMSYQVIRSPLDKTKGQTTYLGSPTSDYRMRLYDKGWERFSSVQARLGRANVDPEAVTFAAHDGTLIRPGDWIRAELQARPQGEEARRAAAVATPEQAWGFTDWTHELARRAFSLDLERAYIRLRKLSKDDEALRWMVRQYRGPLQRLAEQLGGWDCVGLTLSEICKGLDDEKKGSQGRF